MPWFLNPYVYHDLPVYQNPEVYLFLAKLAATALFVRLLRRRGVRGRRLAAAGWGFFFGLFLVVMLSMHTLVISGLRLFERPAGTALAYDFHLYSLLLLAAVLIAQGARSLRAAAAVATGDARGWREGARATAVVLAVAVPLVPLQFFGSVLTAMALVNLGVLALARRGQDTAASRSARARSPASTTSLMRSTS